MGLTVKEIKSFLSYHTQIDFMLPNEMQVLFWLFIDDWIMTDGKLDC